MQRGLCISVRLLDVGADANSVDGQGRPPFVASSSRVLTSCVNSYYKRAPKDGTMERCYTTPCCRIRQIGSRTAFANMAGANAADLSKEDLELCVSWRTRRAPRR